MTGPAQRRMFCFGMGYCATALGRALVADGWAVAGTYRDEGRRRALVDEGFAAFLFDGHAPLADPAGALAGTTHLLGSVPPEVAGDPVLAHHLSDIAALDGMDWVGYLSTTGVYGDRGGGWVDEDSALLPTSERGRRRVTAERGWLALAHARGVPVHVFRLAGIYGPGRSPFDALRAGTAKRIDRPGHAFSRIHVDDVVQVVRASMARPDPGAVYNVCDDAPAPAAEVVSFAAQLLGVPPPPLVPLDEADLSPMALSFWRDNKRVRNARIKDELGVRLAHPDFRSGLRAVLARENGRT